MNNHSIHVHNNSFKWYQSERVDFNFKCMIFDTESCTRKYIDLTDKTLTTKDIASVGAKVYAWGLGCVYSNHMLYGETIEQFLETIKNLFLDRMRIEASSIISNSKRIQQTMFVKFPIAVHNLGWDLEFFKYELTRLGYKYQTAKVVQSKGKTTTKVIQEPNTFHIMQNNNVTYGSEIFIDCPFEYEFIQRNGKVKKTTFYPMVDFFDLFKIVSQPVKNFPKFLNNIDDMFLKMNEEYDYDSYRKDGHELTELELRYLYNDIYLPKKVIEEFYLEGLLNGAESKCGNRTASSIAFGKLVEMCFGNRKGFDEHYELDKKTGFESLRKRMETQSYTGGFTHANEIYVGTHIKKKGLSFDINSSYPSAMRYQLLPFGRPKKGKYGKIPNIDKENEVYIIEVGFDYVRPKTENDALAIFKIGSENVKALTPLVGEISGQEYFSTNITPLGDIIHVKKTVQGSRLKSSYKQVLTNVELEFWLKHYEFGRFLYDKDGILIDDSYFEEFEGLEYGEVLIYKAERGRVKDFIDYYTELKINSKIEGNKPMTETAKLMLNSSYGKYGTKTEKEEKRLVKNKHGIYEWERYDGGAYESAEFYKPYASFVTAYGRLKLWKAIVEAVGVKNFLYCDTDSIYCLGEEEDMRQRMADIGERLHPTDLNCWDVESHFDEFKVLGQKKYIYHDFIKDAVNIRCCGLPKEAQNELAKEGFKAFELGRTVKGKKQKVKVEGGCLLLEVLFSLNKYSW